MAAPAPAGAGAPARPSCLGLPPADLPAGGLHPALLDPWEAALAMGAGVVLALLTKTEGPAYREIGAALAIDARGGYAGAITSGCIEADLVLHAAEVRTSGVPRVLRYGAGSPFFDLKLPCGGALEVTLVPVGAGERLRALARARAERRAVSLHLAPSGALTLGAFAETGPEAEGFRVGFRPALRHLILGAGPEALAFARLVAGLGREHLLLSHDDMVLGSARALGLSARRLGAIAELETVGVDAETAVTLFYHDHDMEPELLRALLAHPAAYIGAQGSRAAQVARVARLGALGVAPEAIARLRGPIGLIPSTRDPETLAISVLAEISAVVARR